MLESFYEMHDYLVEHVNVPIRRVLMDQINTHDRLIAIKGSRGVGKTDFLLAYAKEFLENHPDRRREILYVNFNNFYFAKHSLYDFAGEFVKKGGKILLLDQTFKYQNWSKELRDCYYHYTSLQIIFMASPMMPLEEDSGELRHVVKIYNLRGLSFREYLNYKLGLNLSVHSLEDILANHVSIAREISDVVDPMKYFETYLKEGFYPSYTEQRNFSDLLLKTMNMMLEVDVLLNRQMDVTSLHKLRLLLEYMLEEAPCSLNVSRLAGDIAVSRSSLMNFIKYLKDARLINLLYKEGNTFPMKPSKVYLHNTNLCYTLPTRKVTRQEVAETYFYSALHGTHTLNACENANFLVDGQVKFDVKASAPREAGFRYCAILDAKVGYGKQIPMWCFGLLY